MPQLLKTFTENEQPDKALIITLGWLEKIISRTIYLDLLLENKSIKDRLVQYFVSSQWIVDTLTQAPSLLDELVHRHEPPTKKILQDELRQRLLRIDSNDIEAQMEVFRYFRLSHSLRVAMNEISGLSLMKVSDYLTMIAETLLEAVSHLAWNILTERHGLPQHYQGF